MATPRERWVYRVKQTWFDKVTTLNNRYIDGLVYHGTRQWTGKDVTIVLEIMRRTQPNYPILRLFCTQISPEQEYVFCDHYLHREHENKAVLALNTAVVKGHNDAIAVNIFDVACGSVRAILHEERIRILSLMKTHVWYQSQHKDGRKILQDAVVDYFNRKYTYRVHQLVGRSEGKWQKRKFDEGPVIRLGADAYTVMWEIDGGQLHKEKFRRDNEEIWSEIGL